MSAEAHFAEALDLLIARMRGHLLYLDQHVRDVECAVAGDAGAPVRLYERLAASDELRAYATDHVLTAMAQSDVPEHVAYARKRGYDYV